ncbi:hypothetical protein D3C71_672700 [compost metagenome]
MSSMSFDGEAGRKKQQRNRGAAQRGMHEAHPSHHLRHGGAARCGLRVQEPSVDVLRRQPCRTQPAARRGPCVLCPGRWPRDAQLHCRVQCAPGVVALLRSAHRPQLSGDRPAVWRAQGTGRAPGIGPESAAGGRTRMPRDPARLARGATRRRRHIHTHRHRERRDLRGSLALLGRVRLSAHGLRPALPGTLWPEARALQARVPIAILCPGEWLRHRRARPCHGRPG